MRSRILTSALVAGVAVAALVLPGCSGGGDPGPDDGGDSFEGETLRVTAFAGAWQDAFAEAFATPFEEKTGAKVEITTGADADWFTQLRAAGGSNPPLDMSAFTPQTVLQASRADLLEVIDTDKLDAIDDMSTFLMKTGQVEGVQYGVPLTNGNLGLGYRPDLVPAPPTDWSDMWDEKYCGHIAISPITYAAGLQLLAGLVHADGGELANPDDVEAAFAKLEELAPCVSSFPADAASVTSALQNGDAWIAPFYDARVFTMQAAGDPVDFAYPESGAVSGPTVYTIAAGNQNEDLAYAFLNTLTDPDYAKVFAEKTFTASGNNTVEYSPELADKIANTDEEYANFTIVDYVAAVPKLAEWQTRWSEIFAG